MGFRLSLRDSQTRRSLIARLIPVSDCFSPYARQSGNCSLNPLLVLPQWFGLGSSSFRDHTGHTVTLSCVAQLFRTSLSSTRPDTGFRLVP